MTPISRKLEIAAVVIGRNEGERLRCVIASALPHFSRVVYVDSGSSDGSVALARSLGVDVAELDPSTPFSAGRARNAGFLRLLASSERPRYVQFIDGDCELVSTWLPAAVQALDANDRLAVVCGRRRERYPDASIYNRLCDLEWEMPLGDVTWCGGDFLARTDAFEAVGGFSPGVIAGEEPELCSRLRRAGWRIERLGAEMTLHDAAITRFSQWWRRAERSGHAVAQGALLHGRWDTRLYVRPCVSIVFWAFALPVATVAASMLFGLPALSILLAYPILAARAAIRQIGRGHRPAFACLEAAYFVLAKWPECIGICRFLLRRASGMAPTIIEYKTRPRSVRQSEPTLRPLGADFYLPSRVQAREHDQDAPATARQGRSG